MPAEDRVAITELIALHGHLVDDGNVDALSKAIGIRADGSCGSLTYEDLVVRTEVGWRIDRRRITPRRAPLGR